MGYFEKVIYKLAGSLNPKKCAPRTNSNLPERHFREIGSPAIEGITIATLEIMLTPVSPSTIIKLFLDLSLLRESHHVGVSALTLHAIGLLIPLLPEKKFVHPILKELNDLIETNQYLLEISEPCRLVTFIFIYLLNNSLLTLHLNFNIYVGSMWYSEMCEWKVWNNSNITRFNNNSRIKGFNERTSSESHVIPVHL